MKRPDEATWDWVEAELGTCEAMRDFAHGHGYSQLWRLRAGGDYVWLKMHAYPGKWAGEVYALTQWGPLVGRTPSVIAYREEPRAILLTEASGVDAMDAGLQGVSEERLWTEAGAWLRELQRIRGEWFGACNPDGTPQGKAVQDPVAFVRKGLDQRLSEGREMGLLDSAAGEFIERRMAEWLPSLEGEGSYAIHRDFSPRNWMVASSGELSAVIDFEHARWDVRAADLNRWWDREFLINPRLRHAFFEGYGEPDARLSAQIALLRLHNAVGGYVWATKVRDEEFAGLNRQALERLMAESRL